jgi:hypothetical protein
LDYPIPIKNKGKRSVFPGNIKSQRVLILFIGNEIIRIRIILKINNKLYIKSIWEIKRPNNILLLLIIINYKLK